MPGCSALFCTNSYKEGVFHEKIPGLGNPKGNIKNLYKCNTNFVPLCNR